MFAVIVSACGPVPVSASPQIIPTCVNVPLNPYRPPQVPNQVTTIFTNYKNNLMSYDSARQDAFAQLRENIRQWSDYEDVTIDGRMIRITLTYLDPMLVQYIILNDALTTPNNLMDQNWFTGQIQAAMERLAIRNEIMFIVTITTPSYDSALFIEIPIKKLVLVSASGRRVSPTHHDPILSETIDVSRKPEYGYVGYPVSLSLPDGCGGVVDQWTTSLMLDYKLTLDQNHPFYPLYWNIPYQSLVVIQGNNRPIPTLDPFTDYTRFSKSDTPPAPKPLLDDYISKSYWEEMGRYVWSKVIMMNNK
jgi:hypothetical protein